MADIELVIKMSEEEYKDVIVNGFFFVGQVEHIVDAIKNGTPLPKNHGDLIDRDALIFNADYYEPLISKRDVDFAPTIIEADKAESEDKE